MIVINAESLVTLRIYAAIANATSTILFVVHSPIVLISNAKVLLSVNRDPTGLTSRVHSPGLPILLIEVVLGFGFTTVLTGILG